MSQNQGIPKSGNICEQGVLIITLRPLPQKPQSFCHQVLKQEWSHASRSKWVQDDMVWHYGGNSGANIILTSNSGADISKGKVFDIKMKVLGPEWGLFDTEMTWARRCLASPQIMHHSYVEQVVTGPVPSVLSFLKFPPCCKNAILQLHQWNFLYLSCREWSQLLV